VAPHPAIPWHIPSAILPLITIPVAVLIAFIPLRLLGVNANIMSLGGYAAIGNGDAAIVIVEQTHRSSNIGSATPRGELQTVVQAVKEVAGPSFSR
jgi:Cu(I)/Ag(I) efflux system membrane protein CusA/SilA